MPSLQNIWIPFMSPSFCLKSSQNPCFTSDLRGGRHVDKVTDMQVDMVGNMVVDKVADMEVATISNGVATITNEPAVGLLWNLNPD